MKPIYFKFRILLFTVAFGLAAVPFFNTVYEKWTEIQVDLPQVRSETPIFVLPKNPDFYKKITQEEIIQNRDLSLYDFGGEFSNCFNQGFGDSEFKECKKHEVQTREFIFKHWKEKKQAHIVYEWNSADTGSDTHIFIEPDNNGKWLIILRNTGDFRYQTEVIETRGFSLKFKRAAEDRYPFEKGIYLSVRDENGKEIEGF